MNGSSNVLEHEKKDAKSSVTCSPIKSKLDFMGQVFFIDIADYQGLWVTLYLFTEMKCESTQLYFRRDVPPEVEGDGPVIVEMRVMPVHIAIVSMK